MLKYLLRIGPVKKSWRYYQIKWKKRQLWNKILLFMLELCNVCVSDDGWAKFVSAERIVT